MENKEKMDKTDKYMLVLMGLFYVYMYGKNVIGSAMHVTGWDWFFFIILAVIALVVCLIALMLWPPKQSNISVCLRTMSGQPYWQL